MTTANEASRALSAIRNLDYVIVRARDLAAMHRFYAEVMAFPVYAVRFDGAWIELHVGASLLVLTTIGFLANEPALPTGTAALQLAFRVAPGQVDGCADALRAAGLGLLAEPTDQPWGHRTVFVKDPDGNVVEIYADL